MEPWYTSYYFVDICHLGPMDFSQCLQQNPSELEKRIKWLVALIIRKEKIGSIISSDSHQMLFFEKFLLKMIMIGLNGNSYLACGMTPSITYLWRLFFEPEQ